MLNAIEHIVQGNYCKLFHKKKIRIRELIYFFIYFRCYPINTVILDHTSTKNIQNNEIQSSESEDDDGSSESDSSESSSSSSNYNVNFFFLINNFCFLILILFLLIFIEF